MNIELESMEIMTLEQAERLDQLLSKEELNNGVSVEESKERSSLIYLKQANLFKVLATDDNVDELSDSNYEKQAVRNYEAYLKNKQD